MIMDSKDILISFDTTGSIYPVLSSVRKNASDLVKRLFKDVPELRISIIAHGDYCDENTTYITKMLDFSQDPSKICHFIENVKPTGGGDSPECYEFVLNQARTASWKSGTSKSLIMIGDDLPHDPNERQNFKKLDWKNEAALLGESGVKIYSVQALGRHYASSFWKLLAKITSGYYLNLNQFSDIRNLILAVAQQQVSDEKLLEYENELITNGQMNREMDGIISSMTGRKTNTKYDRIVYSRPTSTTKSTPEELKPVAPGRFQLMFVDSDVAIKEFVTSNGVDFKIGRGFYQFTKKVLVQENKEIILQDKVSGNFFTGDAARNIAGIAIGERVKVSPEDLKEYDVFIQSTSVNRKLLAGTKFLYEVPDWTE